MHCGSKADNTSIPFAPSGTVLLLRLEQFADA
jgi:hypothetical protein